MEDPELGGEIELFFLKVRGVQLDGKRDILALALMAFSVRFIKKDYIGVKFKLAKHFSEHSTNPILLLPVFKCYLLISKIKIFSIHFTNISIVKVRCDLIDAPIFSCFFVLSIILFRFSVLMPFSLF